MTRLNCAAQNPRATVGAKNRNNKRQLVFSCPCNSQQPSHLVLFWERPCSVSSTKAWLSPPGLGQPLTNTGYGCCTRKQPYQGLHQKQVKNPIFQKKPGGCNFDLLSLCCAGSCSAVCTNAWLSPPGSWQPPTNTGLGCCELKQAYQGQVKNFLKFGGFLPTCRFPPNERIFFGKLVHCAYTAKQP